MTPKFEELFKIPLFAQRLNRSHSNIKRDLKWFLQSIIMAGVFFTVFCVFFYNLVYHDVQKRDFAQASKDGVIVIVFLFVSFQYFVLLYHRNKIKITIEKIKKDYELSQLLSKEERMIVESYANQGVYVCKQWLVIPLAGASTFFVKSITLMLYYYCIHDFRVVPYYDLIWPSIIERNREDNFYAFLTIYFMPLIYGYYAAVMYIAYVPLGPIMMLHACGQLEIVKGRIDRLFDEDNEVVIKEKLKGIIKQLQYIYTFVDTVKDIFEVAYELTLKGTTIILPVTFYEVLEALDHGELSLEFITFIIGGFLISSSPCYYSNLLMDKGEDVRLALYNCHWELTFDLSVRNTIRLLLLFALRPVAIRTIFRKLCLDGLTDLFQQSYAIFNLMNAMLK